MEIHRIFKGLITLVIEQGIEVAATAKPAVAGDQHARVHVRGGHMWIARVGDQADAAGPEVSVGLVSAGYLGGESFRKCPVHKGEMDTDLLEHLATHKAHPAPAKVFAAVSTGPFGQFETACRAFIERRGSRIFERFKAGADVFLEGFEPRACAGLAGIQIRIGHAAFDALLALLRQARCCHRPQVRITRVG